MNICEFCIMCSSSALDETIMMEIPVIDLCMDDEIKKRYEFLSNKKVIFYVKKWKKINKSTILNILNNLCKKNDDIFKEMKEKYLFTHHSTSEKIINFIKTLYENEIYNNN